MLSRDELCPRHYYSQRSTTHQRQSTQQGLARVQLCDDRDASAFYQTFRSVPPRGREEPGRHAHWTSFNAGDDLPQVGLALLVERAYWLVTCEIITSGPRSSRCALSSCAWFPAHHVPAQWKFLANSDFLTMDFVVDECSWRTRKFQEKDFLVNSEKAGSEKLGMTLKEAVTRLGRFSHPEVLILR